MKEKNLINTYAEFVKVYGTTPKFKVTIKIGNEYLRWFFENGDDAQDLFNNLGANLGKEETISLFSFENNKVIFEGTISDNYPSKEVSKRKQKYIYVVKKGCIDSFDPYSGFVQMDEQARFTNLKDALKSYNSIKRATDWIASWGVTEIERFRTEDIDAYDNGDFDGESDTIRSYYQPQKHNPKVFYHEKPFEYK